MSMRTRLMTGFSALLVLMAVLTAIGIQVVKGIDQGLTVINDVNGVKQRLAINYRGSVHDRAIALRDVTLVTDPDILEEVLSDIDRLGADYRMATDGMQQLLASRDDITLQEHRALAAINDTERRALPLAEAVIAHRQAGDIDEARRILLAEAGPAFTEWLDDINAFIDLQERMNELETVAARESASGFEIFMIALCVAATVIGLFIAMLLTRWLQRELGAEPHEVRVFAQAIGQGKLTTQAHLRQGDQRSIMASLVGMAQQLQATVLQVRAAADSVASSSEQIAEGNHELASRTEQQASALAETAASMEQLGGTVKQNADNARQVSDETANASSIAVKGGEAVAQVVETMNDLNQRSAEIAEIISMIDEIAFQTNILALNASVEAARAGEHGRGFAVVASEVRLLAQRSANAASQINGLITGNLERVTQGTQLASEAGRTMQDVVKAIQRVTQIMNEISNASAEQSEGVQQVSIAVVQMDRVTQQNSGLVEESVTVANNLRLGARMLQQAMAVFHLDGTSSEQALKPLSPSKSDHASSASPALEWQAF